MAVDAGNPRFLLALADIAPGPSVAPSVKRAAEEQSEAGDGKVHRPEVLSTAAIDAAVSRGAAAVNEDRDYRTQFNVDASALGINKDFGICRDWAGGIGDCAGLDGKSCPHSGKVHRFPPAMSDGDKAKARALYQTFNPPAK